MRRRCFIRLVLLMLILGTLPAAGDAQVRHRRSRPSGSPVVALVNGTLIDGTGAKPMADAVVLVQNERILAAGSRDTIPIPQEAERIDVAGGFILPGFINTHVHSSLRQDNLKKWAEEGVTTVRDVGAGLSYATVFELRDQYRANPLCARVITAGPLITVPGGYPTVPLKFPAMTVESVDDARTKVGQLADAGADVIKIALEPGFGWPTLSPDEVGAIVETAHRRALPVTVHATQEAMYRRALDAGVDDICHSSNDVISDSMIAEMVKEGVYLVPTLTVQLKAAQTMSNLRRFLSAGGKVAMGNDAGTLPNLEIGMPITELEAMWEAGMTRMQIIVAATGTAAEVCRIERDLGTLERGKRADILVVGQNPLEDLRALLQVTLVMRSGVIIRRSN